MELLQAMYPEYTQVGELPISTDAGKVFGSAYCFPAVTLIR